MGVVKTWNSIARASLKTFNGIAAASVKTINGYDATTGGAGYAFTETFEGSNADSQSQVGCDNTGWVSSTSANTPHYATSPAPLVGSYSLRMQNAARTYINSLPSAGGTTVGFYCMLRWTGTQASSGTTGFALLDAADAIICRIESRGSGNWRLTHGTALSSTFAVTIDTVYHVWVDYAKGTGSDGIASIYLSATATKPGSPTQTITTGTSTADAAKVRFSSLSSDTLFDNLVADGTQYIGSDPV